MTMRLVPHPAVPGCYNAFVPQVGWCGFAKVREGVWTVEARNGEVMASPRFDSECAWWLYQQAREATR